jgi:hypothetical protein
VHMLQGTAPAVYGPAVCPQTHMSSPTLQILVGNLQSTTQWMVCRRLDGTLIATVHHLRQVSTLLRSSPCQSFH